MVGRWKGCKTPRLGLLAGLSIVVAAGGYMLFHSFSEPTPRVDSVQGEAVGSGDTSLLTHSSRSNVGQEATPDSDITMLICLDFLLQDRDAVEASLPSAVAEKNQTLPQSEGSSGLPRSVPPRIPLAED